MATTPYSPNKNKFNKMSSFMATVDQGRVNKPSLSTTTQSVQQQTTAGQNAQNATVVAKQAEANKATSNMSVDTSHVVPKQTAFQTTQSVDSLKAGDGMLDSTGTADERAVSDKAYADANATNVVTYGNNDAAIGNAAVEKQDILNKYVTGKNGELLGFEDAMTKGNLGQVGQLSGLEQQSATLNNALADPANASSNAGLLAALNPYYNSKFAALDSNVYQGEINDMRANAKTNIQAADDSKAAKFNALKSYAGEVTAGKGRVSDLQTSEAQKYADAEKADRGALKSSFDGAARDNEFTKGVNNSTFDRFDKTATRKKILAEDKARNDALESAGDISSYNAPIGSSQVALGMGSAPTHKGSQPFPAINAAMNGSSALDFGDDENYY